MTDPKDFTEANRKFWDKAAATYSSKPWQIQLQQQIHDEIHSKLNFIGAPWLDEQRASPKERHVRLLDYACGTGLVSRAFAPFISSTTGIDLSDSMVAKFNETFSSSNTASRAGVECAGYAITGDLLRDPPTASLEEPELYDFDIAAIGLGFHHMADPKLAIKRLVRRVKVGTGVVLIIDWLPDADGGDGHCHHHHHHQHNGHGNEAHAGFHAHDALREGPDSAQAMKTIMTHGFSEEDMRALFDSAGCTEFGFSLMKEPAVIWMGEGASAKKKVKQLFLARGTRQS